MRKAMFDAQCDLAALVYDEHQNPDAVLRDFAADLNARGIRAVGMVQAGQCADSSLTAVLLPSGEKLLLSQDFDPAARGCRLDPAGSRMQARGSPKRSKPLLVVNRFGKRERDGKGLAWLIERALDADIPVVIAVSAKSFADWIKFAGGMSVKLACDRHALDVWWSNVSLGGAPKAASPGHQTVCEVLK
jgi:Protein of unknown function (DUF2478)